VVDGQLPRVVGPVIEVVRTTRVQLAMAFEIGHSKSIPQNDSVVTVGEETK
jgi:hypothetical protein